MRGKGCPARIEGPPDTGRARVVVRPGGIDGFQQGGDMAVNGPGVEAGLPCRLKNRNRTRPAKGLDFSRRRFHEQLFSWWLFPITALKPESGRLLGERKKDMLPEVRHPGEPAS